MNFKLLISLTVILAAVCLFAGTAAAEDMLAIKINNETDLQKIGIDSDYPLAGNYELQENIEITTETWTPVGNRTAPFTGTFNGNNHTITFTQDMTFTIENPVNRDGYGFFGNIRGAVIKDVHFIVNNVTADYPENEYVYPTAEKLQPGLGVIAGWASEKDVNIINCTVTSDSEDATISGRSYVGGLVGISSGTGGQYITNSSSTLHVKAVRDETSLYGANGMLKEGESINFFGNFTGGLVGHADYVTLMNCYSTGDVTSDAATAGGLVGFLYVGNLTNCYATGNVTADSTAGGLIGTATLNYSYGMQATPKITDSYATGNVTVNKNNAGGLIGSASFAEISGCYAVGNVAGNNNVGGLAGTMKNGTIDRSYADGNVKANTNYAGGLIGSADLSTATEHLVNDIDITDSFATGTVNSRNYAGGLVGRVNGSIGSDINISNTYAAGSVSVTKTGPGGLIGYVSNSENGSLNISESYYDANTTGQIGNERGAGLSTDEMYNASTYADWNKDIWTVKDGRYPGFSWQIYAVYNAGAGGNSVTNMPTPAEVATKGKGTDFQITTKTPVWTDREFAGWLDSINEDRYDVGATLSIPTDRNEDVTLEAVWAVYVTYSAGDAGAEAVGVPAIDAAYAGYVYDIPEEAPVWNGRIFTGWYDEVGDKTYSAGEELVTDTSMTLTAQWESGKSVGSGYGSASISEDRGTLGNSVDSISGFTENLTEMPSDENTDGAEKKSFPWFFLAVGLLAVVGSILYLRKK